MRNVSQSAEERGVRRRRDLAPALPIQKLGQTVHEWIVHVDEVSQPDPRVRRGRDDTLQCSHPL